MGRIWKPDEGIDLDVCDDCSVVEDKTDDDILMDGDNANFVLCTTCLSKRRLVVCGGCDGFFDSDELDNNYKCDSCR